MENIIKINQNEQGEIKVSARELYQALEVKHRFSVWFDTNSKYFIKGTDFTSVKTGTVVNNGAVKEIQDYSLTLDMGKQISMMSRTEKGKQVRMYFIQVEKRYKELASDPSYQMALGLKASQQLLEHKDKLIAEMKPKAIFADAVSVSETSVLVGELAKMIKQNGINIGAKRLFEYLRENGYLIKRKGTDYNMPTQKSMELGVFKIKETSITHSDGSVQISKTPKVTGKGQVYFINKFLKEESNEN